MTEPHSNGSGVRYLSLDGSIEPTGTWSLASRAGDFVFIAGMRGIDPKTNELVAGEENRILQAFSNMEHIAASQGATLSDAVRLTVFVTDMDRYRPIVNKVQSYLWSGGPFPPRTIIEVSALNQGDIFEVEGTFYAPIRESV